MCGSSPGIQDAQFAEAASGTENIVQTLERAHDPGIIPR